MSAEDRKTYRLTFPSDLKADQVVAWINVVSGALAAGRFSFRTGPTLGLELWATDRGLTHRLQVSPQQEDQVIPQLRSMLPGIRVERDPQPPSFEWTYAVELGQHDRNRTMRIYSPEVHSASLLASVQPLSRGERVVLQWIVSTAPNLRAPQYEQAPKGGKELQRYQLTHGFVVRDKATVEDWQAKLGEVNMLAVLRVGVRASNPKRAKYLLGRVRASLKSTAGPNNHLKRRLVRQSTVSSRINMASGNLAHPAKLAASELAALLAWPIGNPHVAGLPQAQARQLPATEVIPRAGRVLGRSNFPGNERPIAVSVANSLKHLHVCGPTGVGKTALLANLATQDMQREGGVIVMEPKGDLFREVLARVPDSRVDDVIVLDVTDDYFPVGFNILQGKPQTVASELQRLFEYLYPADARGVRVRQGLYHAVLTLMTSTNAGVPMTFVDIGPLCAPREHEAAFSDSLIRGIQHDEELASFWKDIQHLSRGQRDSFFGPLLGRIWQLNARPEIRHIIGQSASTFDMRAVLQEKKILLVNLAGLGEDVAKLVGSLLVNALWSEVQAGAASPANPTSLYLDEFQDFLNMPINPETMLAKARSMGLAMTLVHQHLTQLGPELRAAVMANARSKLIFQTSADDARLFAREFGNQVSEQDLLHLGQFEVVARVATDHGVSAPVTGTTNPPMKMTGNRDAVIAHSRRQHSRPRAEVAAEIKQRRQVAHQPKRQRPNLGGQVT